MEEKLSLEEVTEKLIEQYNDIVINMVARVNEGLQVMDMAENVRETLAPFNKRNTDLNTLYCLQSLMEAQKPSDVKIGEETKYESVFDNDDLLALKKTVRRITTQIYREYGVKKEDTE